MYTPPFHSDLFPFSRKFHLLASLHSLIEMKNKVNAISKQDDGFYRIKIVYNTDDVVECLLSLLFIS